MANPLETLLKDELADMAKVMKKPPEAPPAKVETPPAPAKEDAPPPPAFDPDALIQQALGGDAPPPAPAPEPSDKDTNMAFLRKSAESAKAEAARLRQEKEAAEAERDKYRGELSKVDVAYDPEFQAQFEKPLNELQAKARDIGAFSGLKPEQIEQVIKTGLDLPRPQLKEMLKGFDADAETINVIAQLALEKNVLLKRRSEALQNHEATSAQIRAQRVQQQAQRVQALGAVREQATRLGVRNVLATDTSGFFQPTTPEAQAEVAGVIKQLPALLDPGAGEDGAQHHARQVGVLTKGLAFDTVARRLADVSAKYEALASDLRRRGMTVPDAAPVGGKDDGAPKRLDPEVALDNMLKRVATNRR